ncbi:MAG TPA: hypothetical protein PLD37_00530 [Usitatibacteraceae bacterium]|nr:hypothetical protein [Usitatibacteraceae bacterium]
MLRFLADPADREAAEALAIALARWWTAPGGPVEDFLGLPDSPESWRALRDLELCRAADHVTPDLGVRRGVPGTDLDRRVCALRREIRDFLRRRWPDLQRKVREPEFFLRPVDRHLYRAARCRCRVGGRGEVLPTSRAALKRIIGGN